MDPQALQQMQFGGGVSQTSIGPIALVCLLIAGILILKWPRQKAVIAFLPMCLLIPTDQIIVLGGLHFPMLRIVALLGLGRILWTKFSLHREVFSGGFNGMDKAFVVFSLATLMGGVLLWRNTGELIYQAGNLCDVLGLYFFLRFIVRDENDIARTLRVLVWITCVEAVIMVGEQVTGKNILYLALGGARADVLGFVQARDEALRSTGSFAHPNLAGSYGAFVLPLFIGLYAMGRKHRVYAICGMVAAVIIPLAARSSTGLSALAGGLLALCFWPLRRRMRIIRWGILLTLVSLHIVMKAPVWDLVSRIDLTGSSSSYHRYELINQCIIHFRDWALFGTKDFGTWGWDMWDISNQYVAIADTTGLLPLLSFLTMIVLAFRYVGNARRTMSREKKREFLVWALGASLFANVMAFFGISYFDQTVVAWYALLAMIVAMAVTARNQKRDQGNKTPAGEMRKLELEDDQERMALSHPVNGSRLDRLGLLRESLG